MHEAVRLTEGVAAEGQHGGNIGGIGDVSGMEHGTGHRHGGRRAADEDQAGVVLGGEVTGDLGADATGPTEQDVDAVPLEGPNAGVDRLVHEDLTPAALGA